MTSVYLASTVVMGLFVLGVGVVLRRGRGWRRYSPERRGARTGVWDLADDGRAWIASFVVLTLAATAGTFLALTTGGAGMLVVLAGAALAVGSFLAGGIYVMGRSRGHPHSHAVGEAIAALGGVTILAVVAILIGSAIGNLPMFVVESNIPTIASVKPYTPLELEGRDIYIREGCVGCHSQLIRPFRNETERYGTYSKAGEYVYDHPFLWGSKRTGPDLWRVGRKYPDAWHYNHMYDPTSMSPGSIMPPYPWHIENDLDYSDIEAKISALRSIGVPYPEGYEQQARADLREQAEAIAQGLDAAGIRTAWNKEIIALTAYLQRLGTDIRTE